MKFIENWRAQWWGPRISRIQGWRSFSKKTLRSVPRFRHRQNHSFSTKESQKDRFVRPLLPHPATCFSQQCSSVSAPAELSKPTTGSTLLPSTRFYSELRTIMQSQECLQWYIVLCSKAMRMFQVIEYKQQSLGFRKHPNFSQFLYQTQVLQWFLPRNHSRPSGVGGYDCGCLSWNTQRRYALNCIIYESWT